jgi:hydrogenase-4 membrane subunit HyfE
MKLTTVQIERLYKFTREHFVEHYDLQTELVDHLANGIEKRWEENSKLSFDDALNLEFKQFGICGFSDIIEKYSSALSRKYFKIIFRFLREYIKLPKIIGTICAILTLFYVIRYVAVSVWIIGFLFVMLFLYFMISLFYLNRQYKRKTKQTGKRWKLEEMIFSAGNGVFIMLNFFQIAYHLNILEAEHYAVQMLFAIVLVFVALFIYISTEVLPEKAETLLREAYPEYELSA